MYVKYSTSQLHHTMYRSLSEEETNIFFTKCLDRLYKCFLSTNCNDQTTIIIVYNINTIILVIEAPRYPYSRPEFLYFSDEEIAVSADRITRPVLVPKDPCRMPVFAGYAEVINAGEWLHFLINELFVHSFY